MVKKFVFQTYEKIKFKYTNKKYDNIFCLAKLLVLVVAIGISWFVYIVFVTKASTHGYFYRVEAQKLDQIVFQYNIVKLEVLEKREKLRKDVNFTRWPWQVVGVNKQVVKIASDKRLAVAD